MPTEPRFSSAALTELRDGAGLTQTGLARAIGRDQSLISRFEDPDDSAKPSLTTLAALCRVLDCQPNDLFETVAPASATAA